MIETSGRMDGVIEYMINASITAIFAAAFFLMVAGVVVGVRWWWRRRLGRQSND